MEYQDKPKILLVDDREDNLLSIEAILSNSGYDLLRATSGKQALKVLLKEEDITLILMDVQMPELNGFETAELIYSREKLKHIPIIFITAHDQGDDYAFKGYQTGGVDYLYKPLNPELLKAKVTVFIEIYRKNHQLIAQERKLIAINRSLENEILERKKSESLLSEAQKLTHLGSWEWNPNINSFLMWSEELFRIFGYEPSTEPVSFKDFLKHIHPDDLDRVSQFIRDAYAEREAFSIEHRIVTLSGELKYVIAKGRVVNDGNDTKLLGILLDITDLKEKQEQLRQKDEFISIASHELKTPLTSIKAYNQLIGRLLESGDIDNAKKYSRKNESYISKLNALIEDLLDVSKIQAGKLQFNISEFDFDELVHETVENIRLISDNHQIHLNGKSNIRMKGDKQRLEQVLINYIFNAIKYSPGSDKVIVNLKNHEDSHVQVEIQDFGIGIPQEKLEKIFDRYYRVETTSAKFSGLGIGLYISSEIIRRHEGHTWVESEEGKGSRFYFKLPVNALSGSEISSSSTSTFTV